MEGPLILRVLGSALILIGIVIVSNPELIVNKPVPTDPFLAVERRIWWGLIVGFGILLLFHHQLLPWQPTLAATLASLLVGLLIARFIGIALDGPPARQWLYVAIEVVILVPLVWWYLKVK